MSTLEIVKYVCLAIVIAGAVAAIICAIIYSVYYDRVKKHSDRYKKLLDLNNKYNFYTFSSTIASYNHQCNSQRSFDRLDLNNVFFSYIEKHLEACSTLISKIDKNISNYKLYCYDYNNLTTSVTQESAKEFKVPFNTFINIEESIVKKNKLSPQCTFTIRISASYTSPQGRNSYSKHYDYDYDQIASSYKEVWRLISVRQSRAYQVQVERAKLSDSLRYDVLRRDGFKCQICGATAQEGAKLHVDHIIPVSKGGKTELSNLRTLCDRCNLGKSDKIE